MAHGTTILDRPLERLDQVRKRLEGAEERLRQLDAELARLRTRRRPGSRATSGRASSASSWRRRSS
ncbi:MAG: hypothetical protein OXI12_06300, partial [Gammaproteobacteria bacterium]|nr:hypothetical protein [Gammaproteobacteria bacterium]